MIAWAYAALCVMAVMSLVAFCACGIDKRRAKKHAWRIPERTLLLLSALGGAGGFWLGMRVFRHKTQHAKFTILVPLLFALQLGGTLWLIWRGVAG